MFGHKWEPAQGVIAEARTEQVATGAQHGLQDRHMYLVNVRTAEGRAFQASIPAPPGLRQPLAPGTSVHLEVNPKTGEVRFDPSHPLDHGATGQITSLREAVSLAREMREEMRTGGGMSGGGLNAALSHLGEVAAAAAAASQVEHGGAPGARVIGGSEAAELVHDLLGGGDRQAAIARIRQLRADAMAQGGATGADGVQVIATSQTTHIGGTPPPAPTHIPAGPTGTHGSSGGAPPASFTPVTPPPVTRSGAFGEPAGGSFGGFGDSKSDRIARLEDQRDRGQITPEQFEVQRQQIRDEF